MMSLFIEMEKEKKRKKQEILKTITNEIKNKEIEIENILHKLFEYELIKLDKKYPDVEFIIFDPCMFFEESFLKELENKIKSQEMTAEKLISVLEKNII